MKIKSLLLITLLAFIQIVQVQAQTESGSSTSGSNYGLPKKQDYDRWSVGLTFGVSHLLGDLLKGAQNNNRFLDQGFVKPAFGLQIHHQVSHSIGLRVRGMMSGFSGNDEEYLDSVTYEAIQFPGSGDGKLYAVKYESPLTQGTLDMTYNFGNISFLNRNKNFHMVATLGIGFFNFDAEVKSDSSNSILLRKSGNITELMIPVSLGFKYKINKFDIGLAFEYYKTFTDDVDATVKTYSEFDNYVMLNAAVNYTFGKKNKPMEWVNPMEIVYNDLADIKEKIDILSGDKDKDGVSDLFDKDNSTVEGSKVYGDGTAVDTDGDGVPDSKDADPFTPKGAKVDANGQESDTDGDGVPDSRDLEPGTGAGTLVNFQGITVAAPGDFGKDNIGVDGKSGSSGKNGVGYLPSVFFDLGSATVKSNYHDRILVIAKVMKANPNINIKVTGNCDVRGSENENIKLGQRRADNVRDQLIKQYGIEATRIITETKGEKDPMATSLNPMNRRVDFTIE
ncbi:MAG: OmpA family protein [Bacteroidetes bacterium]|nr:OmpA family protein [Bacteroidota bacterium]